jgi:hypothetical protein
MASLVKLPEIVVNTGEVPLGDESIGMVRPECRLHQGIGLLEERHRLFKPPTLSIALREVAHPRDRQGMIRPELQPRPRQDLFMERHRPPLLSESSAFSGKKSPTCVRPPLVLEHDFDRAFVSVRCIPTRPKTKTKADPAKPPKNLD